MRDAQVSRIVPCAGDRAMATFTARRQRIRRAIHNARVDPPRLDRAEQRSADRRKGHDLRFASRAPQRFQALEPLSTRRRRPRTACWLAHREPGQPRPVRDRSPRVIRLFESLTGTTTASSLVSSATRVSGGEAAGPRHGVHLDLVGAQEDGSGARPSTTIWRAGVLEPPSVDGDRSHAGRRTGRGWRSSSIASETLAATETTRLRRLCGRRTRRSSGRTAVTSSRCRTFMKRRPNLWRPGGQIRVRFSNFSMISSLSIR